MEAIFSSIAPSTFRQYTCCLKDWWNYSVANKKDPFVFSLEFIVKFLDIMFKKGYSYSSINTYKSALSLILPINEEEQKYLKRYLKGLYNQRPSTPRYETTWDTYPVIQYLETLFPLETLSLYQLSIKLIALLALTTGHRIQTFSKITINEIDLSSVDLKIRISERIKTSKLNVPQPVLTFPFFKEKPALCVASTIIFYINKTINLRSHNENKLLLTAKKPHKPATTQTLSRWLKDVLKNSGINVSIYKAYSFRHSSTSAAFRAGINIETIRKTAGWSSNSVTFNTFYNRPVNSQKSFIQGVLNM